MDLIDLILIYVCVFGTAGAAAFIGSIFILRK
jgi:hypothetical protein